MENRQLLMEQKLRRTQMNPHFIFNSLQNVGSLIREKKEGEAVQYLNQFSKLTRQILESSDENYVSLEDEIDLLKNYIGIQQMLYGDRFNFKISVDDEIDPESVFLPPMLTQPFIENAIKHGLKDKTEGELNVRFFMEDKKLYFEVIDNGAGFGSKTSENHKSMAMEITRKRLSFYTKEKSPQVLAENITDALQNVLGAQVRFEIPYIYEN
jgi:sensor histidine kinase YesM